MSGMAKAEAIFIGGNRQTQASDYNPKHGILAYGAGKTIAFWKPLDPAHRGVYATLKGHDAEVTCVRFVPGTEFMITASEDSQVRLWAFDGEDNSAMACIQSTDHHKHTITSLSVLSNLLTVGCADGSVSVWQINERQISLVHSFVLKAGVFPLCMALKSVEDSKVLLAVGGTNSNVFIYSFTREAAALENFQLAATLEGHEDWIKAMDFYEEGPGNMLLATGSQDRYIRLWRIRTNDLIDNSDEDDSKLKLLSNKQSKFYIDGSLRVAINFEALIIGHDDWVSCLKWHSDKLQLLASTADTAVMVWEPDAESGIWVCASRLGELSSKGASTATGSSGGFWSCNWFTQEKADYILTNGKTGSWRMWKSDDISGWEQQLAITGPTKPTTDVAWSPNGLYLLGTSLDQTTRLFARCKLDGEQDKISGSWFEFSRPQIHGYDMICVEPISNTRFISGGDEKIMRSFDEPKGVAQILQKFAGVPFENEKYMPESASLPALGLSSKATADVDEDEDEDPDARETNETKNISFDIVASLHSPPVEDQLQRHTLWPEIEKLYGHGYEISCLDVSPDAKIIASACRSNNLQHAVIRFFDSNTWLHLEPAPQFHNLTITRLRFSKDNTQLLSVSRDRQWAVWKRDLETNQFTLAYKNEKAHTRIIWDCEWAPLSFGSVFLTASRDKSIKLWRFSEEEQDYLQEASIKLGISVTAISVHEKLFDNKLIIAAGLENGSLQVYTYENEFQKVLEIEDRYTPADRISRLRWSSNGNELFLAAASADTSFRIYSVKSESIKNSPN
ncbi:Elongator subunit ELP2 [Lachancea thermotolerans CBS 6340]|uniref:Elongator complex protein 2 n=1 Tax=Lachancea thermotolerans (strain ATCC 56472 / CBS 6340 / NRRL Y-8284) TaxID=559295 RepID=C5DCB2_LACTC|nr:KLTH0B01628p [Lachancea thermotolerans CBS 6340]CAR21423.1 KLTH0B01628p [Lachancea thermotolerans CBS 6340]